MQYPPVSLAYLNTISDRVGVMQHGIYSVPNRRLGYTTDDNARALIVAVQHYENTQERNDLDLAIVYLSYLYHSQNRKHKFRNVMDFQGRFLDEEGTEDCYGRTMWACGFAASRKLPENIRIVAKKLFDEGIVWAGDIISPRSWAYTMLGMCRYLEENEGRSTILPKLEALAESLLSYKKQHSEPGWEWYESIMAYGNAILPLAMLMAGATLGSKKHIDCALSTMEFLTDTVFPEDRLEIIGNDGWYVKGGKRAWYDQQPIDAGYIVYMYIKAYEILGDKKYLDLALKSFDWFFGLNRSGVWAYDPETHGCFDALTPLGVNENQGAESCICFLLAHLAIQKYLPIQLETEGT